MSTPEDAARRRSDVVPGVHAVSGVDLAPAAMAGYAAGGWAAAMVDLRVAADKAGILDAFAAGLRFPGWVGHNWDALDDALRDLSWWPPGDRGRLILVVDAGSATTAMAPDREILRDVLETAARRWQATESPLVILMASY